MSSRLSDAIRRLPTLGRPRRHRVRKAIGRPVEVRKQPRPARAPYVLTLSSRRIVRRTLPRLLCRTCECRDGGSKSMDSPSPPGVQVLVTHGRVTLISGGADGVCARPR
jgi:hypothetical protein